MPTLKQMLCFAATCLLMTACRAVPAAWVVVSDALDYVAYADDAAVSRSGNLVRISDLVDLKVPRLSPYGVAHSSSLAHSEFDCSVARVRTLAFVLYEGPMAGGAVVEEVAPPSDWMPVFDGTLLQALRRFACN